MAEETAEHTILKSIWVVHPDLSLYDGGFQHIRKHPCQVKEEVRDRAVW